MKRLPAVVLLLASAGWSAARGWTPSMEERVAFEAARLMPRALRSILEAHQEEVRAGLADAAASDSAPSPERVEAMVGRIVSMIDGHRPFAEVARALGELAHLICALDNPLLASDSDPREFRYARDYEEYVESNIERYPLVFYGWASPALDEPGPAGRGDVRRFAAEAAARARRYYGAIGRAYAPDNPEPLARRFDVRSLPFGIGSLSYSYSVTDTARIWRHVWRRARGDMGGTPYLASQTRPGGGGGASPAGGSDR